MGVFGGTKVGKLVAVVYLGLVFVTMVPLFRDAAIHHGNGIAFLAATVLTSPFSWVFFWIIDKTIQPNAFYLTGWIYFLEMFVLAFCAAFNALVLTILIKKVQAAVGRGSK
jgi:hypothetical protein